MIIRSYKGKTPDIKDAAFIADNAVIVGDVTLKRAVPFGTAQSSEPMMKNNRR